MRKKNLNRVLRLEKMIELKDDLLKDEIMMNIQMIP